MDGDALRKEFARTLKPHGFSSARGRFFRVVENSMFQSITVRSLYSTPSYTYDFSIFLSSMPDFATDSAGRPLSSIFPHISGLPSGPFVDRFYEEHFLRLDLAADISDTSRIHWIQSFLGDGIIPSFNLLSSLQSVTTFAASYDQQNRDPTTTTWSPTLAIQSWARAQ